MSLSDEYPPASQSSLSGSPSSQSVSDSCQSASQSFFYLSAFRSFCHAVLLLSCTPFCLSLPVVWDFHVRGMWVFVFLHGFLAAILFLCLLLLPICHQSNDRKRCVWLLSYPWMLKIPYLLSCRLKCMINECISKIENHPHIANIVLVISVYYTHAGQTFIRFLLFSALLCCVTVYFWFVTLTKMLGAIMNDNGVVACNTE